MFILDAATRTVCALTNIQQNNFAVALDHLSDSRQPHEHRVASRGAGSPTPSCKSETASLVVDGGGSHGKILATGQEKHGAGPG